VTVIRNFPVNLVKYEYHRADLKADLQKLGFKVPLWSWTVHTLKNMPLDQYKGMLELLGRVNAHITKNLQYDEPVPLTLPWARELRAIKIGRIIGNNEAMNQIMKRCVIIEKGMRVDLSILPWIYQTYATSSR
jgi:hypothetical protein